MQGYRSGKNPYSDTKVNFLLFLLIALGFHVLFFFIVDIRPQAKRLSLVEGIFWGRSISVFDSSHHFSSLAKSKRDFSNLWLRPVFPYRTLEGPLPSRRTGYFSMWKPYPVDLSFLKRKPSYIYIDTRNYHFYQPYIGQAKFLLFISRDGYVKTVTKISSTGNPFVDRILESRLRKRLFPLQGKDYFKEVIVRIVK